MTPRLGEERQAVMFLLWFMRDKFGLTRFHVPTLHKLFHVVLERLEDITMNFEYCASGKYKVLDDVIRREEILGHIETDGMGFICLPYSASEIHDVIASVDDGTLDRLKFASRAFYIAYLEELGLPLAA